MAESDWELGSGFALDGMTVTVDEVEFTHDAKLGPNACAHFKFTDCVDANGEEAEDQEQKFTVGKNYDNNKDGSALVGNGKINENTDFVTVPIVQRVPTHDDASLGEGTASTASATVSNNPFTDVSRMPKLVFSLILPLPTSALPSLLLS